MKIGNGGTKSVNSFQNRCCICGNKSSCV